MNAHDATLAALFERQVDRTPDAVAVRAGGDVLTYAELDERANRLARVLVRAGAGPETCVGVCLERSLDLMVALLGVLKAGAAYVPLDPDYPGERLAAMAADANLAALVTTRALDGLVPAGDATVLSLGPGGQRLADESSGRLDVPGHPDSLAYVIFTSGSTGRPKGAMNTHAAVANRLAWMQEAYPLDGSDVVLQKTPVELRRVGLGAVLAAAGRAPRWSWRAPAGTATRRTSRGPSPSTASPRCISSPRCCARSWPSPRRAGTPRACGASSAAVRR